MKYKEWLKEWLRSYIKITAKIRTYTRYREIVYNHIVPAIGDYDLSELTPLVIQKFITNLLLCGNLKTGGALSANSVNSVISVIQGSLRIAWKLNILPIDIANNIIRPKITEKRVECFSVAEQKRIEKFVIGCNKPHLSGIIICLYTGLRIGELLALEWNDIDFKNRILSVNKSCHYGIKNDGKFGKIIDSPKTKASERVIPLPKQIISLLKELKRNTISDRIISKDGKDISTRTYQRQFSIILKKLNLSHRGFHSLRHTFATRALECGMDVKTLSEILGHKSPTVTLNRYAHSMNNHKKQMMDRLGSLLSDAKQ